jgi:hypothetical protein
VATGRTASPRGTTNPETSLLAALSGVTAAGNQIRPIRACVIFENENGPARSVQRPRRDLPLSRNSACVTKVVTWLWFRVMRGWGGHRAHVPASRAGFPHQVVAPVPATGSPHRAAVPGCAGGQRLSALPGTGLVRHGDVAPARGWCRRSELLSQLLQTGPGDDDPPPGAGSDEIPRSSKGFQRLIHRAAGQP